MNERAWLRSWRGRHVLLAVVACLLAASAWTAAQPEPYRAECILQYERGEAQASGSPIDDLAAAGEAQRTQHFLLTSETVLERVVEAVGLDRDLGFLAVRRDTKLPLARPLVVQRLKRHIKAEPIPGTRLVRIVVDDDDAQRAAKLANAVSTAYLDHALDSQMLARQRSQTWLAAQIDGTSARLQQLDRELLTVASEGPDKGVDFETKLDLLTSEIKSLSSSLTGARVQQIETAATVAKLRAAQRDDPFDVHAREFDENPHVQSLRTAYLEATLRLREISAADGDAGAERSVLERRISGLYETTRREIDGIARSLTLESTQAQSIEAQLKRSLDDAYEAAATLRSHQLARSRVERERGEALGLLATLRERANSIGLAGALGSANAKVVAVAAVPLEREHRPWARNLGLAALLSIGLGLAGRRWAR